MALKAFVGVPGSGKSYRLVYEGVRALAQGKRYRKIYPNFAFDLDNLYDYLRRRWGMDRDTALERCGRICEVHSFNDLIDCQEGLILFDEAHMWMPSGMEAAGLIPTELIGFFTQHRKVKTDIILATQRLGSVNNNVRELIEATYMVQNAPGMMYFLMKPIARGRRILKYTLWQDDVMGKGTLGKSQSVYEGMARVEYMILDPVVANCYNSWTIFEPPIIALERKMAEAGDKKYKARSEMGLKWDLSRIVRRNELRGPRDGLPALNVRDMLEARERGRQPWQELRLRLDAVRTSERASAAVGRVQAPGVSVVHAA